MTGTEQLFFFQFKITLQVCQTGECVVIIGTFGSVT